MKIVSGHFLRQFLPLSYTINCRFWSEWLALWCLLSLYGDTRGTPNHHRQLHLLAKGNISRHLPSFCCRKLGYGGKIIILKTSCLMLQIILYLIEISIFIFAILSMSAYHSIWVKCTEFWLGVSTRIPTQELWWLPQSGLSLWS